MALQAKGRFFDGLQSRPFAAELVLTSSELSISYVEDSQPKTCYWPLISLKVMVPPEQGRAAVIGSTEMSGARLSINEEHFYNELLKLIPKKKIKQSGVHLSWRMLALLLGIGVVLFMGILQLVNISAPFLAKKIPQSWDEALGRYVIEEVAGGRQECIAPEGLRALNKITTKLSQGDSQHTFKIKVIKFNSNIPNAFATSGFYIVIMSGLLNFADNADEVAGVMAHEMGHAIQHHPTQTLLRMLGIRMVMASLLGSSSSQFTNLLVLHHSRIAEHEADSIAVKLLNKAKVDKKAFIRFFQKIAKEENSIQDQQWFTYISSHPATSSRIEFIEAAKGPTQLEPILTPSEWSALKHICDQTAPLKLEANHPAP